MASNPNEHLFNNKENKLSSLNKNNILNDNKEYPDNLYVYSLGIRDIQAKSIEYEEVQAYVTKDLSVSGNVMEIELEATEEHPIFDELDGSSLSKQTSIEYYITYKKNPGVKDWIPILPRNEKKVVGERLLPDTKGLCELRFPAINSTIKCYINGLEMSPGTYSITQNNSLIINNYNNTSIYTVNYTPNNLFKNPWTFKLEDYEKDIKRITETFPNGTAYNKHVELSYSPYIDLNRIRNEEDYNPNTSTYKPIEVYLKNASIQGVGNSLVKEVQPYNTEMKDVPYTYNKTLYEDKSWSDIKNYDLRKESKYLGFDYYHWKNKIVFTEHFNVLQIPDNRHSTHGNAEIEINYDVLMTNFRMKVILRRNTSASRTATPKLEDFKILFKTIE